MVFPYQININFKPICPTDVVFLRTVVAANPAPLSGATDVFFELMVTDEQSSFDVVKRSHQGTIMGKRLEHHLESAHSILQHITYYAPTSMYFLYVFAKTHFGVCVLSSVGVVQQVKQIIGCKNLVLEVGMNYVKSGVISHVNVVVIHIFVSEFWF